MTGDLRNSSFLLAFTRLNGCSSCLLRECLSQGTLERLAVELSNEGLNCSRFALLTSRKILSHLAGESINSNLRFFRVVVFVMKFDSF